MSGWQVGDLALCVDDRPGRNGHAPFTNGHTYRVTEVLHPGAKKAGYTARGTALGFSVPNAWGCDASRFRKIRPDKHESCEPEFVTLLKKRRVDA